MFGDGVLLMFGDGVLCCGFAGEEDSEEEEAPPYSHSPIDPTPDHLASTLALQVVHFCISTLCIPLSA